MTFVIGPVTIRIERTKTPKELLAEAHELIHQYMTDPAKFYDSPVRKF